MATLRLTLKWRMFNQEMRNVLYFAGGDAVQANAQTIGDYVRSVYVSTVNTQLTNQLSLYGFDVKELDVVSNPTIEYTFTSGVYTGGSSTDPVATQIAYLVTFIALTAKPNRKRHYQAGLTEGSITAGRWVSASQTAWGNWAAAMLDVAAGTSLTGVAFVVSRLNPNTGSLVGSNILETFRLTDVPATQRRRRIGVGI